jgi:hypothetical protein
MAHPKSLTAAGAHTIPDGAPFKPKRLEWATRQLKQDREILKAVAFLYESKLGAVH